MFFKKQINKKAGEMRLRFIALGALVKGPGPQLPR